MTGFTSASPENHPWWRLSDSATEFPQHNSVDSLPLLVVESPLCRSVIAPQGAQLLTHTSYGRTTSNNDQLLWLSPTALFVRGKPLRGGVPLCLPWFGPHNEPGKPQHGFARNEDWQLLGAQADSDGNVVLSWGFGQYASQPHPEFPWRFSARLTMTLGTRIELGLEIQNCDTSPMPLSWALHSYHPVSDLAAVRVRGLAGCDYLDNTRQLERRRQQGDVQFNGELDRIYLSVPDEQVIATEPALSIRGSNCPSAIVWNPGHAKAAALADVGAEHGREFICLERGNAGTNALSLDAGASHRASVSIGVTG
ncbi:MAG: D-hexose-6-phosphate mutarotase [Gammaproteobacteria bacterium]|nr:D-hexose-6-phosphate mutarotase [Gammaproteobacteria bacterium]